MKLTSPPKSEMFAARVFAHREQTPPSGRFQNYMFLKQVYKTIYSGFLCFNNTSVKIESFLTHRVKKYFEMFIVIA